MLMTQRIDGLIAAVFTPFKPDGSLHLAPIEPYADLLVRNGVHAVFVCGTTGESASLSLAERKAVVEHWVATAGRRLTIIVHVGHNALPDACDLARHAQKAGAHAIGSLAPSFFKPGLEPLVGYCAAVAAAAPERPFYYYRIPSMTGVNVPVAAFLEQAAERIPTLAGAKFTYEDLMDLQRAMRVRGGRYQLLFGRDETLLAGLALGCTGAVGTTYNYDAPLYQRVIAAFAKRDFEAARREQHRAAERIGAMVRAGGLPAAKALMARLGMDCGPVRLPLAPPSPPALDAYFRELDALGFDDGRCR
jgi:N-acetylneuraminate lyase